MCYQAAPGPSRLHNVVVVSVAGQLAHRCPLRELYVQLLEPISHLFEAKTIDEYSEDDAPANIDTERPHAHCTGAATVRGRRMKKNSARKRSILQICGEQVPGGAVTGASLGFCSFVEAS